MVKVKNLLFLLIFFITSIVAKSQTITKNDGVVFYCGAGSVVWVNGEFDNKGDSLYNLADSLTIVGDLLNEGRISGDGIYQVGGNWINNDTFKKGLSTVVMNNTPGGISEVVPNQVIEGSQITAFYNLSLAGVGIKSITQNDTVTHYLDLNDREFYIENHIMSVSNIDPLAIHRTTGFVSDTLGGWLSRKVGVAATYLFPLGSSGGPPYFGPMRYRPVEITTHGSDTNRYIVGFFNYDATNDGFDIDKYDHGTICHVDSMFYHKINRLSEPGTDVDVTVYFDETVDGSWSGLANWNNPSDKWINIMPVQQLYSPMWGITKLNWNTWNYDPYTLVESLPSAITIDGPPQVCLDNTPVTYTAWGDCNDPFVWTIVSGHGHFVGDSTHCTVQILWDSAGTGVVTMQEVEPWGFCFSQLSTFVTTLFPQAFASFSIDISDTTHSDTSHIFAYDLIHFIDHSHSSTTFQWNWNFGDGYVSTQQSPYHVFATPGFYNVCLSIATVNDCVYDTCRVVDVEEGIEIPNVFTPNGDGYNDVFDVRASGISQFHLQVFNRWGALLFESESPSVKWDGRTLSGTEAAAGTYFYILNAKSDSKDYSTHGYVTLLRN